MGGCSSKPKTAEFEGVLEVQEDKSPTEAPKKSLEVENAGLKGIGIIQESSERSIQTLATERKQDDVGDIFAERDKQVIAGFSPKSNFQEERQVLKDDNQHVKQILTETLDNFGADKGPTLKEEMHKPQINPEVVASELHKDPVFNMKITKTIPEAQAIPNGTQKAPFALPGETIEDDEEDVFSDSKTLSLKDICTNSVEYQVETMGFHNGLLEMPENLSVGGKEILELQKEPSVDVPLGLQEDAHTQESSSGTVEAECYEAVSKNDEHRLDDSVGYNFKGQGNQFGEGSKECVELGRETEVGASEMDNAASSAVLVQENGKDGSSKSKWEDGSKSLVSDEAAEKVINGACFIKNGTAPDALNLEPSKLSDAIDVVHPTITTDVSVNNLEHVGDQQDLMQEENDVNGDAIFEVAVKDLQLRADNHLMNGFVVKEPNVEMSKTTHADGQFISPNSSVNNKHSLDTTYADGELKCEVQGERQYAAEGQPKADASCALDELTASQVIATKKPEAESIHVKECAELDNPAQDIPAPDIDEVLEKLASEFERQESLARAAP